MDVENSIVGLNSIAIENPSFGPRAESLSPSKKKLFVHNGASLTPKPKPLEERTKNPTNPFQTEITPLLVSAKKKAQSFREHDSIRKLALLKTLPETHLQRAPAVPISSPPPISSIGSESSADNTINTLYTIGPTHSSSGPPTPHSNATTSMKKETKPFSLFEQTNAINKMSKENFDLKMKIQFLQENYQKGKPANFAQTLNDVRRLFKSC